MTIAVACCKHPCTLHIGWGFVEVWRGPVCLAVLDRCFPWEVIIEPVVELLAASLNCTVQCGVESPEDQLFVSRCCVVSGRGTSTEKSYGRYLAKFDSFQYSVDSSQLSVFRWFAISFRLWLLWSLHSGSRWPFLWYATQHYFLGNLQNHNWWYCARWTPTVMFCCLLCIDCLRNTWNLVDQFRKLLSNVTWSFTFESSWNPIPERGSPTCCCSRTLNYLKAYLYRLPLQEQDWTSLYAPYFWGTKHMSFFLKRLGCCWNSIASFQRVICHWLFLLMVLPDSGIPDIVPDDATFWGAGLCFFRCFWLNISLLRV